MASVEFDAELGDMHHDAIPLEHRRVSLSPTLDAGMDNERAFPLLLGLVIHGSADGLALGVANLSNALTGTPNAISVVVFLALILHKGMHYFAIIGKHNSKLFSTLFSSDGIGFHHIPSSILPTQAQLQKISCYFQRFHAIDIYCILHAILLLRRR